jgi:hypothetical protein
MEKNPLSAGTAISSTYISNHFWYSSKSEITLKFSQSLKGLRHPTPKFPQLLVRHDHIEDAPSFSSHHCTLSVVLPLLYSTDTHVDRRAHTRPDAYVTPYRSARPCLSTTATPTSSTTRTPGQFSPTAFHAQTARAVIAVGENVTRFVVGDRVSPIFDRLAATGWERNGEWRGGEVDGGLETHVAFD